MKKILFSLLMISSFGALASGTWHTSKVAKLYPQANGSAIVIFEKDHAACNNANTPNYHSLIVKDSGFGVTDQGFKNMYSALLAAGAAGKDVTIYFDSSSTGCTINRLSINF